MLVDTFVLGVFQIICFQKRQKEKTFKNVLGITTTVMAQVAIKYHNNKKIKTKKIKCERFAKKKAYLHIQLSIRSLLYQAIL